ncbi:hypothetical protein [Streptomyces mexicanus]|uniref:hypothetical protein n=1 Tax=Streptomyces mexicanus TaxID=178566 RepID=UPI003654F77D
MNSHHPDDNPKSSVEELAPGLLTATEAQDSAAALARYRSLTDPERTLLTTGQWPPAAAVWITTAKGTLWLDHEEAATHPATRSVQRLP